MKTKLFFYLFLSGLIIKSYGQAVQSWSQHFNGFQVSMRNETATLDLGNTFTMEAWVFLKAYSPYAIIMGKTFNPRSNDPYMNYGLSFNADGKKAELIQTNGLEGSYRAATSPDTIPLNTWIHIAGTLASGQMKLYINGNLVATETSAGNPSLTTGVPFAIGSGSTSDFQTTCCGFVGAIQQARVWNQEQTQIDIQNNMNVSLTGLEAGLLAYWPMNDSTGQSIVDITPNALHLFRGITPNEEGEDPYPVRNEILANPYFNYTYIALPDLIVSFPSDLIVIDFDSDNKKDLLVTQVPNVQTLPASFAPMQCVKNNGNMIFSLDTIISGIDSLSAPRDFVVADFNNDNKSDLFIADHGTDLNPFPGGQNRIYFQDEFGSLVETSSSIPNILDFSHNVSAADIDEDSDIDLYICNLGNQTSIGPRLLINNGSGNFTVNTSNLPINVSNLSTQYMSSCFADIDNDGDKDLILGAADYAGVPNDKILINNGHGSFLSMTNLPTRYGGSSWGTVSITAVDVNNDNWVDLLMSTLFQYQTCKIQLFINNKNGTFSDSTQNIPQNWPTTLNNIWIKNIKTADLNNDGWKDLLVCLFDGKPTLFFNTGNTKFVEATHILGVNSNFIGYDVCDFDNDGFCDISFLSTNRTITIAKNLRNYVVSIDSSGVLANINKPISKHDNNLINFYPNPVKDNFKVKVRDNSDAELTLRIIDVYGFVLREYKSNQKQFSINISDLSDGVYIIETKYQSCTERQKIIIQR